MWLAVPADACRCLLPGARVPPLPRPAASAPPEAVASRGIGVEALWVDRYGNVPLAVQPRQAAGEPVVLCQERRGEVFPEDGARFEKGVDHRGYDGISVERTAPRTSTGDSVARPAAAAPACSSGAWSGKWHAARWPVWPKARRGGSSCEQISCARTHLVRKRHPEGGFDGEGSSPRTFGVLVPRFSGSGAGIASRSPAV